MNPKRAVLISAIVIIPFYLLLLAGMFWLAGTTHLPLFWAVFGSQALISLIAVLILDPELVNERFKPKGKDLDPVSLPLIIVLLLAHMVIAALDVGRFHWSDTVPIAVQWVAFAIQALGWIGFTWAMQVNRYFSSAVRLQEDRGQTVITTGPYHWIRHPGYGFVIVAFLAQGIALGSWLSVLPLALLIPLFFRRTLMEEKMLFENLKGYEDYAKATPYRWVPFIW